MNLNFLLCSFVLSVFVHLSSAVKLPSYIQKCDFGDENLNECITKSASEAWSTLTRGDRSVRFHNLTPLKVKEMYLDTEGHLQVNLTDCTFFGLEDATNLQIELDFLNRKLTIKLHCETCKLLGHYDVKGRILVLPIFGNGPANVTFKGGDYDIQFNFDIIEGKGNHYIKILDSKLNYELKRAYFKLDNLFNGNKILAEQMNVVLDENWREVNAEIGSQVGKALGVIFSGVLRDFFARVPLQELFNNFTPV